jgi:hypothetical protein
MKRILFSAILGLAVLGGAFGQDADEEPISFRSPNGRYDLQVTKVPNNNNQEDSKLDVVETASNKMVGDLGMVFSSQLSRSVLVWSADSKRIAFGSGGDRHRETTVYFWNGSAFVSVPLPDDLPSPHIKFRKGANGAVKNYGGGVRPIRWLKSGDLELSSEEVMLSRVDDMTYTGTIVITIGFDARHHAVVKKVSKTKTRVE